MQLMLHAIVHLINILAFVFGLIQNRALLYFWILNKLNIGDKTLYWGVTPHISRLARIRVLLHIIVPLNNTRNLIVIYSLGFLPFSSTSSFPTVVDAIRFHRILVEFEIVIKLLIIPSLIIIHISNNYYFIKK